MKKLILMPITLLFCLFSLNISFAQRDIQNKMDELMNRCKEYDLFSGTVLIAKNGKAIYQKALGYADRKKSILNELDTKFNIGSIGKTFTAVLILQLYESGKIDLTKTISDYLPENKIPNSNKITIHHILTHTSGLFNYMAYPKYQQLQNNLRSLDEVMKLIEDQQLIFETPGERFSYSNSGFIILGKIIEKITGKKYSEYLNEIILIPLGMNNSGLIYREQNIPKQSIGYIITFMEKYLDNLNTEPPAFSDGGMYTTVEDMLKYDQALCNNKLLKDKTIDLMYAGGIENIKKYKALQPLNFGYGWGPPKFINGKTIVMMTGGAPGISASFERMITDKYTLIILSNYGDGAQSIGRIIESILLGRKYELPSMRTEILLYKMMKEKGLDYFSENFLNIFKQNKITINFPQILNSFGYELIREKMYKESIAVFRINIELFPNDANAYDSLGEAYMLNGDRELAIKSYEKTLEMNPKNPNAVEQLKKLKEK
jgi:CubicO group peptidase (beta-lactamase class C family)